jgi:hypothetical protein
MHRSPQETLYVLGPVSQRLWQLTDRAHHSVLGKASLANTLRSVLADSHNAPCDSIARHVIRLPQAIWTHMAPHSAAALRSDSDSEALAPPAPYLSGLNLSGLSILHVIANQYCTAQIGMNPSRPCREAQPFNRNINNGCHARTPSKTRIQNSIENTVEDVTDSA